MTWPHETGWENADPAESNHEVVHFTLDSDYSADLSNKKLSLTIQLASDTRGSAATAAAYTVSLVSVSTYNRVVSTGGAGTDAGGASGFAGAAVGGSGGLGGGGTGGSTVVTEIGYSEAESAVADRATLRFVGDRATVTFPLPNKTSIVSSYDPTRVIKINIRIYSTFSNGQSCGRCGRCGRRERRRRRCERRRRRCERRRRRCERRRGRCERRRGRCERRRRRCERGAGGAGGAPVYDYLSSVFSISEFVIKDASAP